MNLAVIKIGGSLLEQKRFSFWVKEISKYIRKQPCVIVHGGGKEISSLSQKLRLPVRFVRGRRYTDSQTMEVVEMVLCGKVNPAIVVQLGRNRVSAIGLSGRTAQLVLADRVPSLGFVGKPTRVKTEILRSLLDKGSVPVIASISSDRDGNALNTNADEMASAIASAMKAKRLILFTDVAGILDGSGKTVGKINRTIRKELSKKGILSGGMIPKVESAFRALQRGVQEVWILQGSSPLKKARGTAICQNENRAPRHPFA
ncbi:MAG: acetylglutamate kinase [Elusimicrobia bacterium]|nr:acetylglutamate kinase [Elusimicrobiota bacterium]